MKYMHKPYVPGTQAPGSITSPIAASAVATSAMTLFSYLLTGLCKADFREPDLLAKSFHRISGAGKRVTRPMAWLTHYLIGAGFAWGYEQLLKRTEKQPSLSNGLAMGAAAGLVGTAGWHLLLKYQPLAPGTKRKEFYTQLVVAHVLFGATLAAVKK